MSAPMATASLDIAAAPQVVYAHITDLDALAEMAAETTDIRWRKGSAAAPGAVFRGSNRNGWRRWTTTCTVTDAEPGRRFAFEVTHTSVPVSRWQYDIEPAGDGCRVTESMWDRRPGWFARFGPLATGVGDRRAANAENIRATLARLKARVESVDG
jgi:uncharacterized protein YndB with AHSA1/START domain